MRGMVFSEFLAFVEKTAGEDMVDDMIDACDLPSGGAYTTVGNYDHEEILKMVTFLNEATGMEVAEMVQAFGQYLFKQLAGSHAAVLGDATKLLDFLEGIESHIHIEVRKLYPDAELPEFETDRPSDDHLIMKYKSTRPFADLAHGMMLAASEHFDAGMHVARKDMPHDGHYRTEFDVRLS